MILASSLEVCVVGVILTDIQENMSFDTHLRTEDQVDDVAHIGARIESTNISYEIIWIQDKEK